MHLELISTHLKTRGIKATTVEMGTGGRKGLLVAEARVQKVEWSIYLTLG